MEARFLIEHSCPQCGAPAELEETDRLFACPFCRVKSYLLMPDLFRYVLPHKAPHKDLTYVPYWRLRGAIYSCVPYDVQSRFVDASTQGLPASYFPPSVGLRSQVLKLRFALPDTEGAFLPPGRPAEDAVQSLSTEFSAKLPRPLFHQTFVGDTLSLIYAPFYLEGKVFDGLTNKAVSPVLPEALDPPLPEGENAHWPVTFVPTLCPDCGWDLAGERNALSLTCTNCGSVWESAGDALARVPFACLPGGRDTAIYLPFWRMTADVGGIRLKTYADLARAAKLPKRMEMEWETQPFSFWAPAFKVHPHKFLTVARLLTLAQPQAGTTIDFPRQPVYPVTLPRPEAVRAAKTVLATLLSPPLAAFPRLREIEITPREVDLVYVPFAEQGDELAQADYRVTVSRAALGVGMGF